MRRSLRRPLPVVLEEPTPAQIGAMITEDELGLPIMAQSPVSPAAPADGSLSSYNGDGGAPHMSAGTEMRACQAETCANNQAGRCQLEGIDINQYGGCSQYQAMADGADTEDGQSRYDEVDGQSDSGDSVGWAPPATDSQRGSNGPWDPRGGGY